MPISLPRGAGGLGVIWWHCTQGGTTRYAAPTSDFTVTQSTTLTTGREADKAIDRDDSTSSATTSAAGSWWQIDFGTTVTVVPNGVTLQQNRVGSNFVRNFLIQGSNDGSTWTTLHTGSTTTGTGQVFGADFTNTTAYRYMRVTLSGTDSSGAYNLILNNVDFHGEYDNGYTGSTSNYFSVVMGDRPAGYWRLAEASGDLINESGRWPMTVTSGTRAVTGLLTGDSDAAISGVVAASASGNTSGFATTDKFSAEGWVRFTSTTNSIVYLIGRDGTGRHFQLRSYNQKFELIYFNSGIARVLTAPTTWAINTTYHVVGVYDNGVMSLYVNNTLVATSTHTYSSAPSVGSQQFQIGYTAITGATIDEVAIYDYALAPGQVLTHYNAGLGIFGSSLPAAGYAEIPFTARMNEMAETSGLSATAAANVLAGTSGLALQGALNVYAETQGLSTQGLLNMIAGTSGLSTDEAARRIGG